MKTSESIDLIATALVAAQGEAQHANFDGKNPHFQSKYASLAEVIDTLKPVLDKHGLCVLQMPEYRENLGHVLVNRILHKSGQFIESEMLLNPVKNDPQAVGSAITYGKRYSLTGVLCIASEDDDDGNAASHAPTVTNAQAKEATWKLIKNGLQACTSEKQVRDSFPQWSAKLGCMKGNADHIELTRLCKERIETLAANDQAAA